MEKKERFYSREGNWDEHYEEISKLRDAAFAAYEDAQRRENPDADVRDMKLAFVGACTAFAMRLLADRKAEREARGVSTDDKDVRDDVTKYLEWHLLIFSTPARAHMPSRGGIPQIIQFYQDIVRTGRLPENGDDDA